MSAVIELYCVMLSLATLCNAFVSLGKLPLWNRTPKLRLISYDGQAVKNDYYIIIIEIVMRVVFFKKRKGKRIAHLNINRLGSWW